MHSMFGHLAPVGASDPLRMRSTHPNAAASEASRLALTAPIVHRDGNATIALTGKPRIGIERFDAATIARRLLSRYRESDLHLLALLRGPFALAIVDLDTDTCVLAIDRMGIETLSWNYTGEQLVFGTSAAEVARASPGGPKLNHQALFDYMLRHMVAAPDTAYVGVSKLSPAHCLTRRGDRLRIHRYWAPDFERAPASDIVELERAMLPTLRRAVAACEPDDRTGAFLSGGLDSSTVTGVLTSSHDSLKKAFSVGFGVDEFNELEYARIAARQFGCEHYEYEVTPADIVELIPRIASAYDEPFGNSSAVPTFCCARLAKEHGVEHLLAGDGGDELFGGNERYMKQRVFELYWRLPTWLRESIIQPAASRFDPETSLLPFRKFSSYVRQARVMLPERFETWNMIYREGPPRVFDGDFLSDVDTEYPLRKMREVWDSCPSTDLLDRMLWYDWKFTLADNDLRKVCRMTELAGVRVSYPMLDEELIDLSTKVPSSEKIRGGELRSFFKRAARGFLPEEVLKKEKHGFGLPFGVWLKTDRPLQELVFGSLESLKSRRLLDSGFIERVATEHRAGDASYYGYAIWDLVMLEQWLSASDQRSAAAALDRSQRRALSI